MTEPDDSWSVFDARTGARVTIGTYRSQQQVEAQIAGWRARDARGRRPDIHDLMPHLVARRVVAPWPAGSPEPPYVPHSCPDCGHDDDGHLVAADRRCVICGCTRYQ